MYFQLSRFKIGKLIRTTIRKLLKNSQFLHHLPEIKRFLVLSRRYMNLNFQIGLTKTGSPLELLLKNGFHLIGEELLKFLSPSDISKLRKIFRDCNDLILNDCFFLFHS